MFGIGYLEVEAIIAGMGGSADRALIRRRFKYLQRMSFPPRSNTGRGRRAVLDLEQVLQIIMAVELMQVGASPTRAVRIVRTNWPELRPALALGWLVSRKPAFAPLRDLLVMNAGAFEDAGRIEDPAEPVSQPFRPQPAIDTIMGLTQHGPLTKVTLDPARLAAHLINQAHPGCGYTTDDIDAAFMLLWTDSRMQNPGEWMSAALREHRMEKVEGELQAILLGAGKA